MNKGFLFILVIVLLAAHASAQNNWRLEYKQQGDAFKRSEWLYQTLKLRKKYVQNEVEMLEEAMVLADELKTDTITAKAHLAVGKYYQRTGEMQGAWDEFQLAKRLFLKARMFNYVGGVIYYQSIVLLNQGLGDSLIRYLDSYKGLHKFMTEEGTKLYLRTMNATAYQTAGKKQTALKEYEIILPLAYEIKDTSLILATIINLGMLQNTFDSTMMWYLKGLPVAAPNSPDKYAELLLKIGFVYSSRDDQLKDSALYYFLEAEKNEQFFVSPILKIQTKACISDFFMNKEEYNLALPYLRSAVALSSNIPGNNANLALHNLGICFINLNKKDSATYYLKKYKAGLEEHGDDYQWMLYYQAMAKFSKLNGDTCSVASQQNRNLALSYAIRINEARIAISIINDATDCVLKNPQTGASLPLVKELLIYLDQYQPIIKSKETLYSYASFLSEYARVEALYGNKDHALDLYKQLTEVFARIEAEKYILGHNEALVKYKTELKDQEILYSKRKNISLSIGAILLSVIIVIVVFALYKTNLLNKKVNTQKTELQQLNVVKDRLFSVISHDMRAPVSSLLAFIQLLDKGKIPAEKMPSFTDELKVKLGYTAGLMDNLLNWAHSQMQGYKPVMKTFDLGAVAADVVNLLQADADKKNITIENKIVNNTLVTADENMTSLLLRNLIGNAIKFTHANEKILVAGFNEQDKKGFMVKDVGVGISNELVDEFNSRLIEGPLKTALGTANEKGTGLGLMLCKTFATLMGGNISLKSEPGKGSCFTVYLPA